MVWAACSASAKRSRSKVRRVLVSIAGSKPCAFQADSLQQVSPLPFVGRAPGPAADALVGFHEVCRFPKSRTRGSAPQNQVPLHKVRAPGLQATFSRNQSYRLSAGSSALAFSFSAIGIADGRSDGKKAFLRLRGGGQVGREAGEIINAEAATPDFSAELMNELLC